MAPDRINTRRYDSNLEMIEARFYKTSTIFYSKFTSNIWQLKKKLLSRLMPYWSVSVYNSYKILIDREVSMWECHGLERAEWYLMKPIRFATHYFYSHLPDETYIKLRKLPSHYYIYAENEPWENDIVELAIRRINNFYYKLDLIYQYQKDTANEMSAESLSIFLFFHLD